MYNGYFSDLDLMAVLSACLLRDQMRQQRR